MVVQLFLPRNENKEPDKFKNQSWVQIANQFDPIGTLILIPSIICLLLALQWGGQQYSWSSGRVVALLVVFAVSIIGWTLLQYFEGENATIPWQVATQRSVASAALYIGFGSAAFMIMVYYLPTW